MYRYSAVNRNGDAVVREGYDGNHNLWRIEPKKGTHGTYVSPPIALLGWRLDPETRMYALDVEDEHGVIISSQLCLDRPPAPKVTSMSGKSLMYQARRLVDMHAYDFFLTEQNPTYSSVRKNDTMFNDAFGLQDINRFAIATDPDANEEAHFFYTLLLHPSPFSLARSVPTLFFSRHASFYHSLALLPRLSSLQSFPAHLPALHSKPYPALLFTLNVLHIYMCITVCLQLG